MNYMPEVLKMLGVEMHERFKVSGWDNNPYHFDKSYNLINCFDSVTNPRKLFNLLRGFNGFKIEKLPWKPKLDDYYYFVDANGGLSGTDWRDHAYDYILYNTDNCFKTKEEITDEIKERILQEMKGKYEGE